MKKYISLFVAVINFIITTLFIAVSPSEVIPIHYNINGVCDAYASKWNLLWLQLIPFLLSLCCVFYSFLSTHLNFNAKNRKYSKRVFFAVEMFFIILFWVIMIPTLSMSENLGSYFDTAFLVLFGGFAIFWSNMFPKLKQNSYIGIRTNATMKDEVVWRKTHRLAGYLGVASGIAVIVYAVFTSLSTKTNPLNIIVGVLTFIIVALLIPSVYAHYLSKKIK